MLPRKSGLKTLIQTGLLAGTLDGLAAALLYFIPSGKDPLNVFRFIASGVFGKEALAGGVPMALAGIFFHYVIATGWTVLFFLVYPRVPILSKSRVITGIFYGMFVWLMMNLIVLPLSNVSMRPGSREAADVATGMSVLIVCIGLPITFMISRYYRKMLS